MIANSQKEWAVVSFVRATTNESCHLFLKATKTERKDKDQKEHGRPRFGTRRHCGNGTLLLRRRGDGLHRARGRVARAVRELLHRRPVRIGQVLLPVHAQVRRDLERPVVPIFFIVIVVIMLVII